MNKYSTFVLFFLYLIVPNSAVAEDWVLCGNCITDAQFEYAAISAHGERPGEWTWAVANPNSATFRWVSV
ncbi:MAG: hypothetical protein U1A73_15325, partial [Pseudomonas sp.]|nr:hypothetical protein [Pseudomonas sp.]